MKYKYYDKGGRKRLIAESESPIQFNVARFPIWKNIKPVVEEEKVKEVSRPKSRSTVPIVEKEEIKKVSRPKSKKKTEVVEDTQQINKEDYS